MLYGRYLLAYSLDLHLHKEHFSQKKKKKVELFPIKIKKKKIVAASLEIIEGCVVSYP